MTKRELHETDDAAEALLRGMRLEYLADTRLVLAGEHVGDVLPELADVDFGSCNALAHGGEVKRRRRAVLDGRRRRIGDGIPEDHLARGPRCEARPRKFDPGPADGTLLVGRIDPCAHRLGEEPVETVFLEILAAFHKVPETLGQTLRRVVHVPAPFEQVAAHRAQHPALFDGKIARKVAREHGVDRLLEAGGLDGIVEQAPEREEGSACRAEPDEIEPCEDVLEDVAPRARALHDAAAKVSVERLEAVAHAMKVAHKPREERENLACAL